MILLTGGAGYIGSHIAMVLHEAGRDFVILDNFDNAHKEIIGRLEGLCGKSINWVEGDCLDERVLEKVFSSFPITSVVHLAGLKAVGESFPLSLEYYSNNVGCTFTLLKAMRKHGVMDFVFSSSATVYSGDAVSPMDEKQPLGAINPYGRTKEIIETVVRDLPEDAAWRSVSLRYFNPVGAHPSGQIGEWPQAIPNNLFPIVAQVAAGERETLSVFGDDYDTADGTCVRDYVHVCDLAEGHLAAIEYLERQPKEQRFHDEINLGTGRGQSVKEVVDGWSAAAGFDIPCRAADRRPGDKPAYWADPRKAKAVLNWQANRSLDDMCESHWKWWKGLVKA